MKSSKRQIVKLYASEVEAEANEGRTTGTDGSIYDSIEEAEYYFPEGGVFAFVEDEGIRVAWNALYES